MPPARRPARDRPPVRRSTLFALPAFAAAHPELAGRYPSWPAPRRRRQPARCGWRPRHVAAARRADGACDARAPRRRARVPAGAARRPAVLTDPRPAVPALPRLLLAAEAAWLRRSVPRVGRGGPTSIVVPSEYVRATVVEAFGIPAERVVVAPHGLPAAVDAVERAARPADAEPSSAAYGLHGPRRRLPGHHLPPQEPRRARAGPGPRSARPRPDVQLVLLGGRGPGRGGAAGRDRPPRPRRPGRPPGPGARRRPRRALRRWPTVARLPEPLRGVRRPGAGGDGRRAAGRGRRCHRAARGGRRRRPAGRRPTIPTAWAEALALRARRPGRGRPAPGRGPGAGGRPSPPPARRRPSSTPTVWPSREARRPLPPLRARRRPDRRGDHAASSWSWPTAATSSTSSRRCRGTSTTGSSRRGPAGWCGSSRPSGARSPGSTRSRPTRRSIPRRAVAFGGVQRPRRRWPACAAAGSTACWPCRRRSRSADGWGDGRRAGGPLVFNIQDVFPDVAIEVGAITDRPGRAGGPVAGAGQLPAGRRRHRAVRRPARQRGRQAARRPSGARCGSSRTSSTPRPSGRSTGTRPTGASSASATRPW